MRLELPGALFGKSDAKVAYALQFQTAGFPDAAADELRRLAEAVQWKGAGGTEPYSSCFALWPVGDQGGSLVARISDAGRDVHRRPHTLQIEAAYLTPPLCREHGARLSGLLQPDAWPEQVLNRSDAGICLTLASEENTSPADSVAAEPGNRRVLVKRTPHLAGDESFDWVCMPTGETVQQQLATGNSLNAQSPSRKATSSSPDSPRQQTPSRRGTRGIKILAATVLVLLVASSGLGLHLFQQFQDLVGRIAALERRLQENEPQGQDAATESQRDAVGLILKWLDQEQDLARQERDLARQRLEQRGRLLESLSRLRESDRGPLLEAGQSASDNTSPGSGRQEPGIPVPN